ncbi:MAG: CoA ester lyase [Rhizobium sp.]|nr:MAG: CoA ester lyase [Rhizobium sp.]
MNSINSHHPARLRRSVLSVPAINVRALEKTHGLSCDAVIFDLEDSVAPEKKAEARANLRRFFTETPLKDREAIIRVNGLDTEFFLEDMAAVIACRPDAVLLPKVDGPDDVQRVADMLAESDATESLRIWAMIETPRGVLNAAAIAGSGRTAGGLLDCFVVGLNDLRKETGVAPEPGRTYVVPFLMQVILAARAYGLDAIDSVSNEFKTVETYEAECAQGRAMGFDGKMLIHPAQIDGANRHFGFSPQALAEAKTIVSAFADPATAGLNVISLNGRMVERLHLEQAERLLAKAQAIEAREGRTA